VDLGDALHPREVARHRAADELGILTGCPGRGADDVREDDAYELALLGHGRILRLPALLTGLRIATGREIDGILTWLRDCIELCGRPLDLMSDNGSEFVHWMPGMLNRFGKTLRELEIRQIKTQVNTPWTNGKIESFSATLKSELLDREVFRSLGEAEAAMARFADYYNYHRLHGEIGWLTPAERFDGTPFTDRGFDHIPALSHLVPWLAELRAA
jgi:hypothetical protein